MVRMYHDNPVQTAGPTTADVPEEAVGWMQRVGWYLKQEEAEPQTAEPVKETASTTSRRRTKKGAS